MEYYTPMQLYGILFSLQNEGNSDMYDNTNEPGDTMLSEISIITFHEYGTQ
jgi:hypothetical protein